MLPDYTFKDPALLEEALTHPSRSQSGKNYERLEFLGDAVLDLVISDHLFSRFPGEAEGALAKRRAALVCGETLAAVARKAGLGENMLLGEGEKRTGGDDHDANLANTLEALIGALYKDGGLTVAKQFILTHFADRAATMTEPPRDPKTTLQEWAQAKGLPLPVYTVIKEEGPSHAPEFTIEVSVEGVLPATATGTSKRNAERDAAMALLNRTEE